LPTSLEIERKYLPNWSPTGKKKTYLPRNPRQILTEPSLDRPRPTSLEIKGKYLPNLSLTRQVLSTQKSKANTNKIKPCGLRTPNL
jgi:hypothetical protein